MDTAQSSQPACTHSFPSLAKSSAPPWSPKAELNPQNFRAALLHVRAAVSGCVVTAQLLEGTGTLPLNETKPAACVVLLYESRAATFGYWAGQGAGIQFSAVTPDGILQVELEQESIW